MDPRKQYFAQLRKHGVHRPVLAREAGLPRQRIYDLSRPTTFLTEDELQRLAKARATLTKSAPGFDEAVFAAPSRNPNDLLEDIQTSFRRILSAPYREAKNHFPTNIQDFTRGYQRNDVYVLWTRDAMPVELSPSLDESATTAIFIEVLKALARGAYYLYVTPDSSDGTSSALQKIVEKIAYLKSKADELKGDDGHLLRRGCHVQHIRVKNSKFLVPRFKFALFKGPTFPLSSGRASFAFPLTDEEYVHAPLDGAVARALHEEMDGFLDEEISQLETRIPHEGSLTTQTPLSADLEVLKKIKWVW